MRVLLRPAGHGAAAGRSNRCASTHARGRASRLCVAAAAVAGILATAELARAQDQEEKPTTADEHRVGPIASFLAGGAIGLGAHETGHLLFDAIFDAQPRVKRVSFHGLPFLAITHRGDLSDRREFVIDSAGFWVQHAGSEAILTRHRSLRTEHAPMLKGILAFNVLASVAYAGAAFARTGPIERDTRGMAGALRWKEPVVAAALLVPAVLDGVRYYRPDARWAVWGSRGTKIGLVLLVVR